MGFREQIAANENEETVVIEEVKPAENADLQPAEGEETEELDEDGEPKVIAEWQKAEAEELDGDKPKFEKSLKAKKKLKGLLTEREGELTETQKENERLRLELENLKSGSLKSNEPIKRPVKADFYDDDGELDTVRYHTALDEYDDYRTDQRGTAKDVQANQNAQMEAISEGVGEHYTRAQKLVEESGINPDVYRSADTKFRRAFIETQKDNSDKVADGILSMLGEGSEKVSFFIGNNEAANEKLQTLLRKDTSGLKAAMYLGAENERLKTNTPTKKISRAKAPATNIKSDAPASGVSGKLQKQYDQAHSKGDTGKAIKIKRQAKAAKIDVSGW